MAAMDSVLLTVPVSSPLHPQAILPCLQGYLKERGFAVKSIDSSLEFFWHMLGDDFDRSELAEFADDPIKVLKFYNDLETRLAESSSKYRDCRLGLRSIKLAYDRTDFGEINKAIYDAGANPFVDFFNQLIDRELAPHSPRG